MNRDQTQAILKARSALTSQPYGEDAIDTWHEALGQWAYADCRKALIRAAREHPKISLAHLVESLPHHSPPTPPADIDNRELISCDEYIRRNPNTQEARNLARHRHPTAHQP
jgi:hypothetical protein